MANGKAAMSRWLGMRAAGIVDDRLQGLGFNFFKNLINYFAFVKQMARRWSTFLICPWSHLKCVCQLTDKLSGLHFFHPSRVNATLGLESARKVRHGHAHNKVKI